MYAIIHAYIPLVSKYYFFNGFEQSDATFFPSLVYKTATLYSNIHLEYTAYYEK